MSSSEVVYGFKLRWADTMLCLGADFAEEIRSGGFGIHRDFANADSLSCMSEMVRDASGNDTGHEPGRQTGMECR